MQQGISRLGLAGGRLGAVLMAAVLLASCTMRQQTLPVTTTTGIAPGPGSDIAAIVQSAPLGQSISLPPTATGGGGIITVRREYFSASGKLCRSYIQSRSFGDVSQANDGVACRDEDGTWAIRRTFPTRF